VYTGLVAVLDAIGVAATGFGTATTTDNQWIVGTSYEKATDDGGSAILLVDVNVGRY
jgi:hypothetical protein